jgi:hypothetical protein
MTESMSSAWEGRLLAIARRATYPPTPPLWAGVRDRLLTARSGMRQRRLTWAQGLAVLVVLLVGTMLTVPEARAALVRILQVGVVRVLAPSGTSTPTVAPAATAAPSPTAEVLLPPFDLSGRRTWDQLRGAVDFELRLPSYPEDLGAPDLAFLQDIDGPMVILVWRLPGDPSRARLAMHILGPGTFGGKAEPRILAATEVHGRPALWTEGPHSLILRSGDYVLHQLVTGNVLIWEEDDLTYRLETALSMEEAVRIAESLR